MPQNLRRQREAYQHRKHRLAVRGDHHFEVECDCDDKPCTCESVVQDDYRFRQMIHEMYLDLEEMDPDQ
jgi:hypothetical protein